MPEQRRAVGRDVLDQLKAGLGRLEQSLEPSLAVDERQEPQVLAIDLDQVERIQEGLRLHARAGAQQIEAREPLLVADDRLAVDVAGDAA